MQVEIDGRTVAEPDRRRLWRASARPLLGTDPDTPAAVGCLLVEGPLAAHPG
jgi:hypothetical protein